MNNQREIRTRTQLDEEINLFRENSLISNFLEVAVGQTTETARNFLQRSNWNIEEAINHYFINNNNYGVSIYQDNRVTDSTTSGTSDDSDSPWDLLFEGSFEEVKFASMDSNLWLIVNLQSRTESASRKLNRDVWLNDDVWQAVESNFVLFQAYDNTIEGQKISTFYKIDCASPVVLIIDPITGQKMHMWSGVIEANSILEVLMKFKEAGPREHIASLTRNRSLETNETFSSSNKNKNQAPAPSWGGEFDEEDTWSLSNQIAQLEDEFEDEAEVEDTCLDEFPVLTEEPKGDCDKTIVCNVCVRFPDGKRKQRRFLKSEPIQLLWSFCYSHMEESKGRAFKLVHAIPGASKTLDYGVNATFDESGLANSIISVTWDF